MCRKNDIVFPYEQSGVYLCFEAKLRKFVFKSAPAQSKYVGFLPFREQTKKIF